MSIRQAHSFFGEPRITTWQALPESNELKDQPDSDDSVDELDKYYEDPYQEEYRMRPAITSELLQLSTDLRNPKLHKALEQTTYTSQRGKTNFEERERARRREFNMPHHVVSQLQKVRGWDDGDTEDPFRYLPVAYVREFRRSLEVSYIYCALQPRAIRAKHDRIEASVAEWKMTMQCVGCVFEEREENHRNGTTVVRMHFTVPSNQIDDEGRQVNSPYRVSIVTELTNRGEGDDDRVAFRSFYFAK